MELLDDAENLVNDDGGQAHGGLIQHHQLGMGHQRPGHGQHLLLAAGQGACHLLAPLLQPGEIVENHFQVLGVNGLIDVSAHFQVLLNGHLQKDPTAFRHMGQARAQEFIGLCMGDVLVTEGNGARAGVHQAGYGFQNGALACAVGADQSHDLAVPYLEGHILHGMDGPVIDIDVFNLQHLQRPPPCLSRPR